VEVSEPPLPADEEFHSTLQLCAAMVGDAAYILTTYKNTTNEEMKEVYSEVSEWVFSDDYGDGSFRFVCEVLDMDPGSIRQGISKLKKFDKSLLW
jgi:hypothetical protein